MNEQLREHIIKSLSAGIRFDGRKPLEYRNVSVEYGVSKNAEGSSRVKIGETEVIAGVKLSMDKPYSDTPDDGVMSVNAELLPLSSPEFESGPPNEQSIELARVVDRGIRESKAIDTKKLCVKKGEKVWMISVDIVTINDSGNLIDAAAIAALAALKDTKFPEVKDDAVNYKKLTNERLPMKKDPMAVTVYKIGGHFIVDPDLDEEKVFDARLTVTTTPDGIISALQKGGDLPLTMEDVEKMVEIGIEKAKELRKML
ncbi:MAG: exosome complex protein Rrp42 [Candidatus Woesearchaeota archaeon]|nr:exosome complex protein Rrp42 [Candidatus Woesearchaeota archaeon]